MADKAKDAAAMEEKKVAAIKVVTTLFPRIPKVTTVLLDFYVKRESVVSLQKEPLLHFSQSQVVLAAQDIKEKLNRQIITYQDMRDTAENLICLHNMVYKKDQAIAKELGESFRKMVIIIGELATSLEKVSEVPPTDWMAIGDTVVAKTEKLNVADLAPFWTYIPKMSDFENVKLLGAGGFGAVYKVIHKQSGLVSTMKLVACSLFQRHSQAIADKIVASIIRSPFLVRYYCCYVTKDAMITVMEYICGVDLNRVCDKAVYLPTNECRIVFAQLVLAVEHLHLRGFFHRDIKVQNMMILPGGRCKLIDFDTNKLCIGHFSRRCLKGYFLKTAFEHNDGESAGTVPYMAPEILKRRPYGRACDWWSCGVTLYKLMTGRVPFRGDTKEELRDKIINSPLKWPKPEEFPLCNSPEAKDMVFKFLKKNPVERLGSTHYIDIKTHAFFDGFNWKKLSASKEVADIRAIAECMGGTKDKKAIDQHLSVGATSNTKKRKLLKVEEMIDVDGKTQLPIYTYLAPSFKKLVDECKAKGQLNVKSSYMKTGSGVSEELDYKKTSDTDVVGGITEYTKGSAASTDKSITAKEKMDVMLFREKAMGKFWSFGVTLVKVTGEQNKEFFMVEKVKKGSPAEASHVLEGDVVVAVNNQDISTMGLPQVTKLIHDSGDQVVLTVLSSSAFRILESRRDMEKILKVSGKDNITVRAIKTMCSGAGYYGFRTFEAKAWNEENKQVVHCHVIQKVDDAQVVTPGKAIYPGDILTMVDGVPTDNMDAASVKAALAKGNKPEMAITIAPISPLRVKRPSFTRLHETVVADAEIKAEDK
ncbi:microtubule-associated serine/threonine-protein kinase 2-like [Ornithodoros turicata]|uniref:microtubule-associated serine/threonine-protein kinase 2-like n=1 Tax=Ornithodoros turicata TaxID=34597 RepID=UPI003138FF79